VVPLQSYAQIRTGMIIKAAGLESISDRFEV
jgi:hypothetical protein